jgi:hypothetical protein
MISPRTRNQNRDTAREQQQVADFQNVYRGPSVDNVAILRELKEQLGLKKFLRRDLQSLAIQLAMSAQIRPPNRQQKRSVFTLVGWFAEHDATLMPYSGGVVALDGDAAPYGPSCPAQQWDAFRRNRDNRATIAEMESAIRADPRRSSCGTPHAREPDQSGEPDQSEQSDHPDEPDQSNQPDERYKFDEPYEC